MCGIWSYLAVKNGVCANELVKFKPYFEQIRHRGPDDSRWLQVGSHLIWGFHRLAINGLGHQNDEPLRLDDLVLICNGEIYNYPRLQKSHNFKLKTNNDCEIILHLYQLYGADNFEQMVMQLDGVFSFQLYDQGLDRLFIANDPIGIRPLYWSLEGSNLPLAEVFPFTTDQARSYQHTQALFWASEPKALPTNQRIDFFPPGSFMVLNNVSRPNDMSYLFKTYWSYNWKINYWLTEATIPQLYLLHLKNAVQKRLLSDRPIGCLLSGGLDSSLVTALVTQAFKKANREPPKTFSIGLKDSPDLKAAQVVADFLGTDHHTIVVTEQEFLSVIPEVIKAIQSYDTTTVRASCGNWLLGRYIKQKTDCIVIFNGDVSEEINASYLYSSQAPNPHEFFLDNIRLLKEVHLYDVLRSARSMEAHSLEPRTPFADRFLVDFVMSIDPSLKMFSKGHNRIEKDLLRRAGALENLLPESILRRKKTAFSDGVSAQTRSWHQIIGEFVDQKISDQEFNQGRLKYTHNQPQTKEQYYYRTIYEEILPNQAHLVPQFWMPRFIEGVHDPSARTLNNYSE